MKKRFSILAIFVLLLLNISCSVKTEEIDCKIDILYKEDIKFVTSFLKFEKENDLRKFSDKLKNLLIEYETKKKDLQISLQKQGLTNNRIILFALTFIVSHIIIIFILLGLDKKFRKKAITAIYNQYKKVMYKQDVIDNFLKEKANYQTNEDKLSSNLLSLLEKDQIFKQQDLSLVLLANKLNTNITYTSQIINKKFGCNYNTLINRYRISYCVKLIEDNKEKKIRNKQLSFDSGFATLSTFYKAFKEEVGITPSQYQVVILEKTMEGKK